MSDWNVDSKLVGHTDGLPTMPGMRPMKIGDDPRRQAKSKMRQPRNKLVIGFDESSRKCEACLATREHPSSCSNRLLAQRILDRWPQAERGAAEEGAGGDCGEGATEENRGTRAKSWPRTICVPQRPPTGSGVTSLLRHCVQDRAKIKEEKEAHLEQLRVAARRGHEYAGVAAGRKGGPSDDDDDDDDDAGTLPCEACLCLSPRVWFRLYPPTPFQARRSRSLRLLTTTRSCSLVEVRPKYSM